MRYMSCYCRPTQTPLLDGFSSSAPSALRYYLSSPFSLNLLKVELRPPIYLLSSTFEGDFLLPYLPTLLTHSTHPNVLSTDCSSNSSPLKNIVPIIINLVNPIHFGIFVTQIGYHLASNTMILFDLEESDGLCLISVQGWETAKAVMETWRCQEVPV